MRSTYKVQKQWIRSDGTVKSGTYEGHYERKTPKFVIDDETVAKIRYEMGLGVQKKIICTRYNVSYHRLGKILAQPLPPPINI